MGTSCHNIWHYSAEEEVLSLFKNTGEFKSKGMLEECPQFAASLMVFKTYFAVEALLMTIVSVTNTHSLNSQV